MHKFKAVGIFCVSIGWFKRGNDQEIKFQEIESHIFQEVKRGSGDQKSEKHYFDQWCPM